MTTREIIATADHRLMPTYARSPVAFVRGDGARLWDADGREYLDFFSCLSVTNLGHAPRGVVDAITAQASRLLHVSNLHYCEPQARLAELLCTHSFADRVFFCNSGAEANEAAIKLARRWGHKLGGNRTEIVTALGSFHGRTLATLTATGQEKVRVGFQPLPAGFRYVPYDDVAALERALGDTTAALLLEPIQGEGGVVMPRPEYLAAARRLCTERGVLLALDEVQTGMGRTGAYFAHQHERIEPDAMTLAKGIAAGIPLGALLAREEVAKVFTPGTHASTFGGNPLATAAACAVMDLLSEGLVERVQRAGERLSRRLAAIGGRTSGERGLGLLRALLLSEDLAPKVVAGARELGLLVNAVGDRVIRLAPPLTVSDDEIDRACALLAEAVAKA